MLLFRLKSYVVLPTIWLPEKEWKLRFADEPAALARVLNRSSRTVLEDLGGFGELVRQARWIDGPTKVCRICREEKPILDFYIFSDSALRIRGECKSCTQAVEQGRRILNAPELRA